MHNNNARASSLSNPGLLPLLVAQDAKHVTEPAVTQIFPSPLDTNAAVVRSPNFSSPNGQPATQNGRASTSNQSASSSSSVPENGSNNDPSRRESESQSQRLARIEQEEAVALAEFEKLQTAASKTCCIL